MPPLPYFSPTFVPFLGQHAFISSYEWRTRHNLELKTWHDETALKACATNIRTGDERVEHIWREIPEGVRELRLVDLGLVSEGK